MGFLDSLPLVSAALGSTSSSVSVARVSGYNADVDIAAAETIQTAGGNFTWPTAAAPGILEVKSASAADTAVGTGARTIQVDGLDANWLPASVTVTLNGVTAVQLGASWVRVNRIRVVTAGSGGTNAGAITVATFEAEIYGIAAASDGQSANCLYTVPDGKAAVLVGWWCASAGGVATFTLRALNNKVAAASWRNRARLVVPAASSVTDPMLAPIVFGERTDIEVRASVAADNSALSSNLSFILVNESQRAVVDV